MDSKSDKQSTQHLEVAMKKITQEQLIKAREELEALYRAFYKQEYGIEEGMIVVSNESYAKRCGCDLRVEKVLVNLNSSSMFDVQYKLKNKPEIIATPRNKNGTWSKTQINVIGSFWKLKD